MPPSAAVRFELCRDSALPAPTTLAREVDFGCSCPRGRLYRVQALAQAHGDRTVGDVVRRFRCQVCGAGAITVVLSEAFERRRVPLVGAECEY